jgi:hypothetical protein
MPRVDYDPLDVGSARLAFDIAEIWVAMMASDPFTEVNYGEEAFDQDAFETFYAPFTVDDQAGTDTRDNMANEATYVLLTVSGLDIKTVGGHTLVAGDTLEIEVKVTTKSTVAGGLGLSGGTMWLRIAQNVGGVFSAIDSSERAESRSAAGNTNLPDTTMILRGYIDGPVTLTDVRVQFKNVAGAVNISNAQIIATLHRRCGAG